MRNAPGVSFEIHLAELRDGQAQSGVDAPEPARLRLSRRRGDALEEIGTERVLGPRSRALRVADELRNEMEIADLGEELGDLAELLVRVDLLQVRLRQSIRVRPVGIVRTLEEGVIPSPDLLSLDDGYSLGVLPEFEPISPFPAVVEIDRDVDRDRRALARVEAAQLTDTAACGHRGLKTPLRSGE